MNTNDLNRAAIAVRKTEVIRLGTARGQRIESVLGRLWVTIDGDPRDMAHVIALRDQVGGAAPRGRHQRQAASRRACSAMARRVAPHRDEFLDRQIWEQLGDRGMSTELNQAFIHLENILKEPTDTGLSAQMNKFWASWQDLANNPSNLSAREAVKASATVLTDTFHNSYKQIEDYGLSMNNPLATKAKSVNDMTLQIYNLNEKIAGVESSPGQKANDARDQRDLVIRKLSDLIDVQTVEDAHGRALVTSGGNLLVDSSVALQISTYGVDQTLSDGSQSSELRLKFTSSNKPFEPRSGSMRGIIDARSEVLAGYKEQLNSLAKSIVESVNSVHASGYTLNKVTGVMFFDSAHTKAGDMSLSSAVLSDSANIAAAAGGKIVDAAAIAGPAGIPAVGSAVMDLKAINPAYQNLTQGSVKLTTAVGAALVEGAGKDYIVDYEKGSITFLNPASFTVADRPLNVKFSYNTTGFPGEGNGENAGNISKVRLSKVMSSTSGGGFLQTIGEYYSAVIGKMGIEKNQNKSRLDTRSFLIGQMDSEQASISGVSIDEELTNMIKFENSYKASAKYIQTISQMMETLMGIQ